MGKPKSRACNAIVPGPLEQYAPGFRSWLLDKGYTPLTTVPELQLMAHVSRWLEREGLTAAGLTEQEAAAVVAEASSLRASAGQYFACSLRAFLRYCHVRGLVDADVSAAALSVTGRRTTMLPRGLEPGQVEALLAACDRDEPSGRRDYAVILLLARLGLRAGEAARLRLDDVSWRSAEIGIPGQGGQDRRPPPPAGAGPAL